MMDIDIIRLYPPSI